MKNLQQSQKQTDSIYAVKFHVLVVYSHENLPSMLETCTSVELQMLESVF